MHGQSKRTCVAARAPIPSSPIEPMLDVWLRIAARVVYHPVWSTCVHNNGYVNDIDVQGSGEVRPRESSRIHCPRTCSRRWGRWKGRQWWECRKTLFKCRGMGLEIDTRRIVDGEDRVRDRRRKLVDVVWGREWLNKRRAARQV